MSAVTEHQATALRDLVEARLRRLHDGRTIRERIVDQLDTLRASSTTGTRGGKGGHGDPTAQAITDPNAASAARDLHDLDRLVVLARLSFRDRQWQRSVTAYDQVLVICHRYEPRQASEKAQRVTADAGDPGCASCSRVPDSLGRNAWEPVHARGLCRWCWEHERATGVLPSLDELRAKRTQGERYVRCAHREVQS